MVIIPTTKILIFNQCLSCQLEILMDVGQIYFYQRITYFSIQCFKLHADL